MFNRIIYQFQLGLLTREFVQHVRMGFFMLFKFKQKPLDARPQWAPRNVENEKQMLSTKSCLVWKTCSCKSLHHNNAASLWSLHDCVSIDLRIDDNCKRSNSMALPGFIASHHPRDSPSSGPQSRERPEALLLAPLSSSWPRILSLEPCGLSEVLLCCSCGCL